MNSESGIFLAGRRCFQTNGTTFLVLFGLSPHEGQNYEVLESLLSQCGVHLGDFLTAKLTQNNAMTDFKQHFYPMESVVENNFATMNFSSAEVTRDNNGALVFRTKSFGPVRALNQELPLGYYDICIKAMDTTTNYNMILCAEAKSTAQPPSARNVLQFYEIPNSNSHSKNMKSLDRKEFPNLPVPLMKPNVPKPTSSSSGSYAYVSSTDPMYSRGNDYLELQDCFSSTQDLSLGELISQLPKIDLSESKPPTPKPRTVTPFLENQKKTKPIMKVQPNNPKVVSPNQALPTGPTVMKAFVHSILNKQNTRMHFLWICDIKKDGVLKLPNYELDIGHFFEGVFEQKNGQWQCTSYEKPITRLMKGKIVYGKIELTATVSKYQPENDILKYPTAQAHHLGVVIDRHSKLSPNCQNQKVTIQKLLTDGKHEWIITGLA